MLIELLKWLPYLFLGVCVGFGAQGITGLSHGWLIGAVVMVYCEYMTRIEVARHVRLVTLAESVTKKETDADADGPKP
jgi:presenilin-like A22 family membrane protease